ncbi:MAG: hypothetical protein ABIZ56_10560, partial [Chthoniobacteraceae bacterium]
RQKPGLVAIHSNDVGLAHAPDRLLATWGEFSHSLFVSARLPVVSVGEKFPYRCTRPAVIYRP